MLLMDPDVCECMEADVTAGSAASCLLNTRTQLPLLLLAQLLLSPSPPLWSNPPPPPSPQHPPPCQTLLLLLLSSSFYCSTRFLFLFVSGSGVSLSFPADFSPLLSLRWFAFPQEEH